MSSEVVQSLREQLASSEAEVERLRLAIDKHRIQTGQREQGTRWSQKALNEELWAALHPDEKEDR